MARQVSLVTALLLMIALTQPSPLDQGCKMLSEYRPQQALQQLQLAQRQGPYKYQDHLRLYENLGIAYAYLEQNEQALQAFDMLLTLDPGHAISYTISPKVTFLFEQARKRARARQAPNLDMSWPRELRVGDPIPLDLEIVADPASYMHAALVFWRLRGQKKYQRRKFDLPAPGQYKRVVLPPLQQDDHKDQVVQIYATVVDSRGNEVLRIGHADQPRNIVLRYQPPKAWYQHWWVWAAVAPVVAAGTGALVFALLYKEPDTVPGTFRVDSSLK